MTDLIPPIRAAQEALYQAEKLNKLVPRVKLKRK